jgi:hypothetical protein
MDIYIYQLLEGVSASLLVVAALKLRYIRTKIHDVTFCERVISGLQGGMNPTLQAG